MPEARRLPYDSPVYELDLDRCLDAVVGLEALAGRSVLVTGATGFLGSFLVDALARANAARGLGLVVWASGRSAGSLARRFDRLPYPGVRRCVWDAASSTADGLPDPVDFVIHAASNAHPLSIVSDGIGTVAANVDGTIALGRHAERAGARRLAFVSSGEVYGEPDRPVDAWREGEAGFVDPLDPRSCYPLAKRLGENVCATLSAAENGLPCVVARLSHTFGPTMTAADSRAHAQFLRAAARGEDIVLKSAGTQVRSYTYVADAASGLLSALVAGEPGSAYNVSNPAIRVSIAELAEAIASCAGVRLVRGTLDGRERAGSSRASCQVLDPSRLLGLGWTPSYDLADAVDHALAILGRD